MHLSRKRFGQHFLRDHHVIDQIITAISPQLHDHLVEIGPGLGALTTSLLPEVERLDAIELDRDLILPLTEHCKELGNLHLHMADALSFDFSTLPILDIHQQVKPLRVIGNLPYQISTPLLFHLMNYIALIQDMHFMLQKEVVDRLAAPTGCKAYGRLSIMIQYHCRVDALFNVSPQAFSPPPRVNSAVVRLIPRSPLVVAQNPAMFSQIVKQAFNYRRKTLHNSLSGWVTDQQLIDLNIDCRWRAEQVSVENFVRISNLCCNSLPS